MSIFNDDRRFGSEAEYSDWKAEVKAEMAREEAFDRACEERAYRSMEESEDDEE